MNDPLQALQALLQPVGLQNTLFPPTSRYQGIETATLVTDDHKTIIYLRRRFCPPPERFALLQEHVVTGAERLDRVTARYFDSPELFWRLCDANAAMRPDELTERPGRHLRVTLPEGIAATPNA